jgi:Tol biopolymer transport system component
VDLSGKSPVRVTDHEANDWNPVWSPDGRWLFFLSNRAGSMNLWRIAIDERTGATHGEAQPLTAPAPYVGHFSLSADGRIGTYAAIVFTSNIGRVGFDARSAKVNGAVQSITSGPHDFVYYDVSPDGRFIAAAAGLWRGREDLYIVPVDGGPFRQLTNDFARDRAAVWARKDQRILFQSDRGSAMALWSINADGSDLRQLTRRVLLGPTASRDGTYVAAGDLNQLVVFDARDFSQPIDTLPPVPDPAVTTPFVSDWSPDGRSMTISSLGAAGVWLYSLDTRSYRRVTDGEVPWFVDGQRLIYSNRGRLSVIDTVSGASHEVLAISGESLNVPVLTADASQLFFTRRTYQGDIWVVQFGETNARPH